MAKKLKGLIIGIVFIALLSGALVFLLKTKPSDDADTSSIESKSVVLIDREEDELKSVTVKNKKGSFTVEKYKDEFVIKDFLSFERYEDNYDQIVMYATDLAADEAVDTSPDNLKKYGLDNPQAQVNITYTDKSQYELLVGNKSPGGDSYYVKSGDSDTVYLLTEVKTARFLDSKFDYISPVVTSTDGFETKIITNEDGEKEEQEITPDINSFTIIRQDMDKPITFVPNENKSSDEELAALECIYKLSSPFNANLDSEKGEKQVTLFYGITAEDVVDVNPDEDDYAKYGFKNPTMKLTIDAKKKKFSHEIIIGSKVMIKNEGSDDTEAYYCIIDKGDVVYRVSRESLSWLDLNIKDILSTYVISPVLSDLKRVYVTVGGKEYKFDVSTQTKVSGESSTEETTKVKYNNKELDIEKFRNFYVFLNAITPSDIVDKQPTEKPVMKIIYEYSGSRKKDTVELVPYDNSRVAVVLNGTASIVTRAAYVDRAQENVEKVINNKVINSSW